MHNKALLIGVIDNILYYPQILPLSKTKTLEKNAVELPKDNCHISKNIQCIDSKIYFDTGVIRYFGSYYIKLKRRKF